MIFTVYIKLGEGGGWHHKINVFKKYSHKVTESQFVDMAQIHYHC